MNVEIKKNLGIHVCSRCSHALADRDFDHCGVCLHSDAGIFFDYRCPACEFLGRYTIAISESIADVDSAFKVLREHLDAHSLASVRWRRKFRDGGSRNNTRFFCD